MQYMTETEIDSIASETGKALAKESKVTITIQPEGGDSQPGYSNKGINPAAPGRARRWPFRSPISTLPHQRGGSFWVGGREGNGR